ncbi:nucleoside-diphosphate-sugar epimerase [Actinoplanes tereljensis]|uniref:Dihydroflavonol-4-reductase n=1 Tax=Paractinoplanes tereljensis TaxID=571912 RepID=A0A919TW24_9ACTN|nr:NAD-dependent epimerase/dehydratase family protein [Actinoplanes tereljensis]GIF25488.1 dihydroflavonol-4-reductase [Actinoplanes tereljensis]
MKVLVTGGTGYVAGWIIVELLRRGHEVRTTVRAIGRAGQTPGGEVVVADLMKDEGWDAAVAGMDYVLHVASPLGLANGKEDLVGPARDGTLRVLRAATAAGVRRVVLTSAANAASPSSYAEEGMTDETLWTDPADPALSPYRRSKTVAEKAAWDFMAAYDGPTELTTILPGAVLGPVLSSDNVGSVEIVRRMLTGAVPGTPRIGLEIVDVRDLADLHIRAMLAPAAAGQRFLGTGEFTWMSEMAEALRAGLGDAARRVPTRRLPNFVVRAFALADPSLRAITVSLGRRNRHSTAKAASMLDWHPRPAAETVVDCARSLLAEGVTATMSRS